MSDEIAEGPPPQAEESDDTLEVAPDIRSREPSAMAVFFAWEKLRLIFNAIYVSGLCYFVSGLRGDGHRLYLELLMVVVLCNGCFSSGPAIEGYLCWLRVTRTEARWVSIGAVNALCIAIAAIWIHRFPV